MKAHQLFKQSMADLLLPVEPTLLVSEVYLIPG